MSDLANETVEVPTTPESELEERRRRGCLYVQGLLAGTDIWVGRAYEDGEPLSAERKAYRVALRAAYQEMATSDDPESVALPDPPVAE